MELSIYSTTEPKLKYFIIASLAFIAACTPQERQHGYVLKESQLAEIKVGESTKEDVIRKFGSPSTRSTFGSERWYYVSTVSDNIAFVNKGTSKQQVTEIEFDEFENVKNIANFSEKDSRQIALSEDKTKTEGNRFSLIQQLVGNVGRFTKQEVQ